MIDKLESGAKATLVITLLLYVTGVLIENLNLGLLGIHSFAEIRPRMVLVGLTFYVYLILPILVLYLPEKLAELLFPEANEFGRAPIVLPAIFYTIITIPIPLHYFLGDVSWKNSTYDLTLYFWKYYPRDPAMALAFALFSNIYLARKGWLLYRLRQFIFRYHSIRKLFVTIWCLAFIGCPMPFVWTTFVNIEYAVGGGQPQCIELSLNDKAGFDGDLWAQDVDTAIALAVQNRESALLLWNETDTMLYVTRATKGAPLSPMFGIPKSRVSSIRYKVALTHVDKFVLTEFSTSPDFSMISDFLSVARQKSATRPATTPASAPAPTTTVVEKNS